MNPLPIITKLNRKDYNLYKYFLKDCLEYSHMSNMFYSNLPCSYDEESFYNWLQTDNIYICQRNHKNIGFIVFDTSETLNRLSIFVHPKVCKLAIIGIARAATIVAYYKLHDILETSFLFSTVHTLVYTIFQNIFSAATLKHGDIVIQSVSIDTAKFEAYIEKNYEQDEIEQYLHVLSTLE